MKMETSLTAPFHGRVREVLVGTNVHVAAQAPLVALEPLDGGPPPAAGERIAFAPAAPPAPALRDQLRAPRVARARLRRRRARGRADRCGDSGRRPGAASPASTGCCACSPTSRALSRPRHDEADAETPWLRSPQEHLHAWLGSLDAETAGLPESFLALLRAALAHYGIADLDRTPALEEACYRLFLAQERAATARAAIVAILERRLDRVAALGRSVGRRTSARRSTISFSPRRAATRSSRTSPARSATATSTSRSSPPRAIASTPRWRPTSRRWPRTPSAPTATSASRRSSACPRPLASLLTARMGAAAPPLRRVLVEAMARRYYRVRSLEGFEPVRAGGQELLMARYPFARGHAATSLPPTSTSTTSAPSRTPSPARSRRSRAATSPCSTSTQNARGETPSHDELADHAARGACGRPEAPDALHRIVVAVAQPARGRGMSAIDTFTFRRTPVGAGRGRGPARPAPDDGAPTATVAAAELRPRAAGVAGGRLRVPRRRPREREGRAPVRARRGARPHAGARPARGGSPRCPSSSASSARPSRGSAASRPADRRAGGCCGTASSCTSGRSSSSPRRRSTRCCGAWRRARSASASSTSLVRGRMRDHDGTVHDRVLRFFTLVGEGVVVEVGEPSTEPLLPLDEGARRIVAARRRGILHPAEIVRLLAPRARDPGPSRRGVRRARSRRRRRARARRSPARHQSGGRHRRHRPQRHRALPRGHAARDPARRSDARARLAGRARVPADHRRDRSRRGARRPARVVRALGRGEDRDGQRHREHGLDRCGAAADRALHPGGRRDQRRRHRDQRRRAALLERRGDDADAHRAGSSS